LWWGGGGPPRRPFQPPGPPPPPPPPPPPTSREVLAGAPPAPRARAQEIVGLIVREQSPKALLEVRGKLYELLVNCIPPELVLRRMALELLPKLDDELKHKVVEHAAFFEHRLQARLASATLPAHAPPPPHLPPPRARNGLLSGRCMSGLRMRCIAGAGAVLLLHC